VLVRPFLDVPKSRLIATLEKAGIAFANDPTNHDPQFTRPRLRALMPALAAEGADARGLARLASRLARANVALEIMTDGAERYLASIDAGSGLDLAAFTALSDEIGSGSCCARSIAPVMRGLLNSVKSRRCYRRWIRRWRKKNRDPGVSG
jgi:tRNA(Ile)-lysidine synthase TilS/MesJ